MGKVKIHPCRVALIKKLNALSTATHLDECGQAVTKAIAHMEDILPKTILDDLDCTVITDAASERSRISFRTKRDSVTRQIDDNLRTFFTLEQTTVVSRWWYECTDGKRYTDIEISKALHEFTHTLEGNLSWDVLALPLAVNIQLCKMGFIPVHWKADNDQFVTQYVHPQTKEWIAMNFNYGQYRIMDGLI